MTAPKGPEGTATGRSGPFVHPGDAAEASSPFIRRIGLPAAPDGSVTHVAWTSVDAGNLAFHVLDAPSDDARGAVAEARRGLEAAMGVPAGSTVYVDQVHSPDVVDADGRGWGAGEARTADAIVSPAGADPLAIMVADCLPVVLVDERTGATAVAHAGRRGLLDGVLENTVERLRSRRSPQDVAAPGLRAWIGPGICGRCYEVPEDMRDAAAATHPAAVSTTSWGTPALDLPAAAEALLAGLGVAVERVDLCTFEDERLFSHRRAPGRGRIAGLVWRTRVPSTAPVGADRASTASDARAEELSAALEAVRGRIARAAADAGRADEPVLVVVTKTHPAEDVLRLAGLGVADVGENRDQEARPKAEAVAAALGPGAPRWHFVGQLQTNKAKHVARYAAAVHSVDRPDLVDALSRAVALRREREATAAVADLACLVQVDLDHRADADRPEGIGPRGGAAPADVPALAARIADAEGLALRGLMCVAPRGLDAEACFRRLAALGAELRARHPEATWLSMGMSGDLEAAVRAGATHVRVGSDVLGARGPRVG